MGNMLKIPSQVLLGKYIIDFSYVTRRGNSRSRKVELKSTSSADAEFRFMNWIERYNKENINRPYSNVKILECVEVDRELVVID